MSRRFALGAAILLLGVPAVGSAATLEELKAQLQQVLAQLSGAQTSVLSATYHCPTISQTLTRGMRDSDTGGQVSELQKFISSYFGVNAEDDFSVTGFFGPMTESYIIKFQIEQNISPALGVVGPLTRAKIAQVCVASVQNTASTAPQAHMPVPIQIPIQAQATEGASITFSGTPTSGPAPLTVRFSAKIVSGVVDFTKVAINFGDGLSGFLNSNGEAVHTYSVGAFAATVALGGETLGGTVILASGTGGLSGDFSGAISSALSQFASIMTNTSGTSNASSTTSLSAGLSITNFSGATSGSTNSNPALNGGGQSCRTPWGGKTVQDGEKIVYQPWFTEGRFTLSAIVPYMLCSNGDWKVCMAGGALCIPGHPDLSLISMYDHTLATPSKPTPPPPPPQGIATGAFAGTNPLGGYAPLTVNFMLYGFTAPSLYPGIPFTLYFGDGSQCGVKNSSNPCGSFSHMYKNPGTYRPYTIFESGYKDQSATILVSTSTSALQSTSQAANALSALESALKFLISQLK